MVQVWIDFLMKEMGLTAQEVIDMTPKERDALFDKFADIEVEEATKYNGGKISDRGRYACVWEDILCDLGIKEE